MNNKRGLIDWGSRSFLSGCQDLVDRNVHLLMSVAQRQLEKDTKIVPSVNVEVYMSVQLPYDTPWRDLLKG